MAPSTPLPPDRASLVALTIASTARRVMSPRMTLIGMAALASAGILPHRGATLRPYATEAPPRRIGPSCSSVPVSIGDRQGIGTPPTTLARVRFSGVTFDQDVVRPRIHLSVAGRLWHG